MRISAGDLSPFSNSVTNGCVGRFTFVLSLYSSTDFLNSSRDSLKIVSKLDSDSESEEELEAVGVFSDIAATARRGPGSERMAVPVRGG